MGGTALRRPLAVPSQPRWSLVPSFASHRAPHRCPHPRHAPAAPWPAPHCHSGLLPGALSLHYSSPVTSCRAQRPRSGRTLSNSLLVPRPSDTALRAVRRKNTVRGLAPAPRGAGHTPLLLARGPQTAGTERAWVPPGGVSPGGVGRVSGTGGGRAASRMGLDPQLLRCSGKPLSKRVRTKIPSMTYATPKCKDVQSCTSSFLAAREERGTTSCPFPLRGRPCLLPTPAP